MHPVQAQPAAAETNDDARISATGSARPQPDAAADGNQQLAAQQLKAQQLAALRLIAQQLTAQQLAN